MFIDYCWFAVSNVATLRSDEKGMVWFDVIN